MGEAWDPDAAPHRLLVLERQGKNTPPVTAAARFDESRHPRHPKGAREGGRFASKAVAPSETGYRVVPPEASTAPLGHPNMTPEQRDALAEYVVASYPINVPLREGGEPHRATAQLDALMDANTVQQSVVVYRGVADPDDTSALRAQLRPGGRLMDRGFVSTSLDPGVVREGGFLDNYGDTKGMRGERPIMFRIDVPAGSRGVYIGDEFEAEGIMMDQRELLLDRETQFRVGDTIALADYDLVGLTVERQRERERK